MTFLRVFQTGESSLGLASAVGLQQGVFRVLGGSKRSDRVPVMNMLVHRGLLERLKTRATLDYVKRMQITEKEKGGMGLTLGDLKELVRRHRGLTP